MRLSLKAKPLDEGMETSNQSKTQKGIGLEVEVDISHRASLKVL